MGRGLNENDPRVAALRERILTPPEGIVEEIVTINGNRLRTAMIPPVGEERGQVILATGFNESFHDHYETIKELTEQGMTVYTFDWAGQGLSDRKPGQRLDAPPTDGLRDDVADLDAMVRQHWQIDFSKPTFTFGYSMGGHITALWQQDNPDLANQLAGSVLPGLMADLRTPFGIGHDQSRMLTGLASRLGLRDVGLPNIQGLSYRASDNFNNAARGSMDFLRGEPQSDRGAISSMGRRARTRFNTPSFGWVHAAYDTLDETASPEFWAQINTPTLILTGTRDTVVRIRANEQAAEALPNGQHITLENADHSLWSADDTIYRPMFDNIHGFMDTRIAAFRPQTPTIPVPANDIEPIIVAAPLRVA